MLMTLIGSTSSFAATDCSVLELEDHSELICNGDEKAVVERPSQDKPVGIRTTDAAVQNQTMPQTQTVNPVPSAVGVHQTTGAVTVSPAASETHAAQTKKAADRLIQRKIQAEQNTRNVRKPASVPAPPLQ